MSTRDRWLDEGLVVLGEVGAPGLRIDRIAARLGLSKGSFHHHFDGADGYKRALLERYETLAGAMIAEAIPADGTLPPEAMLRGLTEQIGAPDQPLFSPELEVAVRAWAFQDEDARRTQERIDSSRIDALQSIWSRILADPERAKAAALLPYLVMVGASVVMPPIAPDELRRVYDLLGTLIPHVTEA